MSAPVKVHVFESAGLGLAPFRLDGFSESKFQAAPGAPVQPGSTCDYCGQGIMIVCAIRSADGKRFKVGCDCVAKTDDAGLKSVVDRGKRDRAREIRRLKSVVVSDEVRGVRADEPTRRPTHHPDRCSHRTRLRAQAPRR